MSQKKIYRRRKIFRRRRMRFRNPLRPELKFHDTLLATNFTGAGTAQFLCLNDMVQGTDAQTRVGQKIFIKSVYFSAYIAQNSLNTSYDVYRLFIVWDKQANGAIFGIGSLLNNVTTIQTLTSPRNTAGFKRFKVIWQKRLRSDLQSFQVVLTKCFKRTRLVTEYNTTNGGTVADINTGSLYLVYMSIDGTNVSSINAQCRIRYLDG